MRIHCPNCQSSFSVADELAEKPVSCPSCSHAFTAPALMTPPATDPVTYSVSPPEPRPQILSTPAPEPAVAAPPTPDESKTIAPTADARRVTFSRKAMHWVGPIAMIALFFLTFFNWMVAAPGGITVYSQSAWQIMTGSLSADIAGDEVFARENELRENGSFSWVMFLTLIPITLAMLLCVADLLEKNINFAVPDAIQKLWPKRLPILAVTSILLFALISLQMLLGMGLASAGPKMADAWVSQTSAKPTGEGAGKQTYIRELKIAEEVARLGIRRACPLWLAWIGAGVAVFGFGMELALIRRGNRPPPSFEFNW